jgi:hypothetical protein
VQLLGHPGGSIIAYIDRSLCTPLDEGGHKFPEAYSTWVNKVLLPTWRAREEGLTGHKTAEWRKWLAEVFYVKFPDLKGKTNDRGYVLFDDGHISYHECPPEAQKLHDAQFDGNTLGTYLPLPEELQQAVVPPRPPIEPGLAMYYRTDVGWVKVQPNDFEAPEDPILRHNREFFNDVWARVEAGIEQPLPPRSETRNRYGGIEPWYTFELAGMMFLVGWRKRVVSIQVETPQGIQTEDIRALAIADNTTYIAHGPPIIRTAEQFEVLVRAENPTWDEETVARYVEYHRESFPEGESTREGGWKNDRPVAHHLEVHAWGKDKTVEYLTTLCRAALLAPAVERAA